MAASLFSVSPCFAQNIIEGFAQGTSYRIIYYSEKTTVQKYHTDSVLNALDSSLSIYKPYSLISRFNQPNTNEVVMDTHLEKVVKCAFKHYKLSKGLFDITIAPLTEIYGFGNKNITTPPTPLQINEALEKVGLKNLRIVGKTLSKRKAGIKIDINGIAQGYSVDVLAEFLDRKGIENYLIELGGEIKTKGTHSDGRKFKIALEVPNSKNDSLEYKTLEIYNTAVTTSGISKKHHINPRTGKVLVTPILSATVIAPNAMDADAIDNYIIAMKPKRAKKWAERKSVRVILVE